VYINYIREFKKKYLKFLKFEFSIYDSGGKTNLFRQDR